MAQIEVKICSGTTCFVMGSSYLDELFEIIPQKFGPQVTVKQSPCLNQCSHSDKYSSAPYVMVGEEVVSNATVEKVLAVISAQIGAKAGNYEQ